MKRSDRTHLVGGSYPIQVPGLAVARDRRDPVKNRLISVLVVGVITSTVGAATSLASSSVTEGLLLTGTDAAHVRFMAPVDSCHTMEISVGYVTAERLQSPLGSGQPGPHSDVGVDVFVITNGEDPECGDDSLLLSGVSGISDPSQVSLESLQSASVNDFTLTATDGDPDDPVEMTLTLDLTWVADERVGTEIGRDPANPGSHSAHRKVSASVTGTLVVENIDGPGAIASALDATFDEPETIGNLDQIEGFLTRYQEIQVNLPEPEPVGPPSAHPDMEGTWVAVDCAQWWEYAGPLDCDIWGDGSTITLTIGPGDTPEIALEDGFSAECGEIGSSTVFMATGYGEYAEDGIWLDFDKASCGSEPAGDIGAHFSSHLAATDDGSSAWQDPDGDGWGYAWYPQQ